MNQQHNNSQIPEGGEQPQVPGGPASDPYDDKLGRPGENTPEIPEDLEEKVEYQEIMVSLIKEMLKDNKGQMVELLV